MSFREWQPKYALHGIATFPVRVTEDGKVPAIRGWQRVGLRGSAALVSKFEGAEAFGLCPGKSSGLTILDVDTRDARVLEDALDRHGKTPVIVRSGSGNYQAWYRHSGEKRIIRPVPDKPIDILGGGFVVAPPSRGINTCYEFIEGKLDDLDRLPTMRSIEVASLPLALDLPQIKGASQGNRNKALWDYCMRSGRSCDDFESLLDVAQTRNAEYMPPLSDVEVMKVVKSAWGYTQRGENRFGQTGVWLPTDEVNSLISTNPDDLTLLAYLRANNGHRKPFMVANGLADTFRWTRKRLARARGRLENTYLRKIRSADRRNGPALYRFRQPEVLEGKIGGVS